MHQTATSLYVDQDDKAEAIGRDHELVIRDGQSSKQSTFTIVLPTNPATRWSFLDSLAEQVLRLQAWTYRELAALPEPGTTEALDRALGPRRP